MRRFGALVLIALASGGCGATKHATTTAPHPRAAVARPVTFRASVSAFTHHPRVGPKWWYVVHATDLHGRPLRARLTVQVVDPLGTAHAVDVGTSNRRLVDFPFTGRYREGDRCYAQALDATDEKPTVLRGRAMAEAAVTVSAIACR